MSEAYTNKDASTWRLSKKGILTRTPHALTHLTAFKRAFWTGERRAVKGHPKKTTVPLKGHPRMFISYAQAKEDIHLLRALYGVHHDDGFYIDVGAFHPDIDSVTKLFYDAGWRGINVEPSPTWFRNFPEHRPRDINLNVAVTEKPGQIEFYDDQKGGLGTTSVSIADDHAQRGKVAKTPVSVNAVTLTSICETHCRSAIHFLKVDVEGIEGAVLRSMDFSRYRPWVLCVESHYPPSDGYPNLCRVGELSDLQRLSLRVYRLD